MKSAVSAVSCLCTPARYDTRCSPAAGKSVCLPASILDVHCVARSRTLGWPARCTLCQPTYHYSAPPCTPCTSPLQLVATPAPLLFCVSVSILREAAIGWHLLGGLKQAGRPPLDNLVCPSSGSWGALDRLPETWKAAGTWKAADLK